MSPLTKLFVVLSVVLSLLLTAATVVYVNKEDIQRDSLTKVKAQLDAKTTQTQDLQNQVTTL